MSDDGTVSAADEEMEAEPEHDPLAKMKAVLSYWESVTKDDRTLSKFDVGFLEHKILSWSIQDVFNKDLLKQQVSDRVHSSPPHASFNFVICDFALDRRFRLPLILDVVRRNQNK